MNDDDFPGSRWWRFDLHNHTPASSDYDPAERSTLQPRDWLLAYMRAGIDAVAVTDHNCTDWIELLQREVERLAAEQPEGWRAITLFPGLEISSQDGLHLLALFGPGTPKAQLDGLLGSLNGWQPDRPNAEQQCAQSAVDVIAAVHEKGGIAVPAHVDRKNGLFFGQEDAHGNYAPVMSARSIDAVLAVADGLDMHDAGGPAALHFAGKTAGRAMVAGSDSPHRTGNAGQRHCWIKMSQPDLAGLRLALLDPECAVRPGGPAMPAPQAAPTRWIRRLTIENLHLHRSGLGPLQVDFNPAYNAVIGGRGSGKSTLIECLRLALARDAELLGLDEDLRRGFENFRKLYVARNSPGMILPETVVTADVVSGSDEHAELLRFTWRRGAAGEFGSSVQRQEGGAWKDTGLRGAQVGDAFPVRIYSQKQVLTLAEKPQALLGIIDDAIRAAKAGWQEEFDTRRSTLLEARRKLRTLRRELARKPALELEHKQSGRKALVFANANFGPLLKSYQRATQQQRAMDDFQRLLSDDVAVLRSALDQVAHLAETELTGFDAQTAAELAARDSAAALRDGLLAQRAVMAAAVAAMERALDESKRQRAQGAWQAAADGHLRDYAQEMAKLKAEGIDSAQEAAAAVAAVDRIGKQLETLKAYERQIPDSEATVERAAAALTAHREVLSRLRGDFVAALLQQSSSLKVDLRSMAHAESAAVELRSLLRLGDKFADVWAEPEVDGAEPSGFLHDATRFNAVNTVAERLHQMKLDIEGGEKLVLATTIHGKLHKRLRDLSPDDFDQLAVWFPQDEVTLQYRPTPDQTYRSIALSSAGQRAAAMLSFLLAHGDEPLLLDQPEDDLDNALVSELVVAQLRRNKARRQLIVVTHNANIVVNGDAELVLTMNFAAGQIQRPQGGGLQEVAVRDSICAVMEGGREAFKQRYKRILEDLEGLAGRGRQP